MERVQEAQGVPRVIWCGVTGKCNAMVLELLGDSLETLYSRCNRKFSMKTVLMLAIQMLDRIEHQHENHFLHRDIKPDNFLMGVGKHSKTLYLIDMGLSKRFRDASANKHIPYRENKKLIGTHIIDGIASDVIACP